MKKLLIILTAILLLPIITVSVSLAQSPAPSITPISQPASALRGGEVVSLGSGEIVNRDYFAAGESVVLSGTVNGDTYLAGGKVLVEGTINGDLLVVGGDIEIRGKVSEDIRVVGGNVNLSGEVGGNVAVGAGTVNVADNTKLAGNLVAGAGTLSLFAPLNGSLTAGVGSLTLGNTIKGDVVTGVGNMMLTSRSVVSGDLIYWSKESANIQPGATVSGQVTHNIVRDRSEDFQKGAKAAFSGLKIAALLMGVVSYLVLGFLFLTLVPNFTKKTVETLSQRSGMSLLVGFLVLILTPILALILLITVVGVPLALLMFILYLIIFFLSPIFVALSLGWKALSLLKMERFDGLTLILGLVIYYLIVSIPILGGIAAFVASLLGVGSLLLTKKGYYQKLKTNKAL